MWRITLLSCVFVCVCLSTDETEQDAFLRRQHGNSKESERKKIVLQLMIVIKEIQ